MNNINLCVLGDGFAKGVGDKEILGWAGRLVLLTARQHGAVTYFNLGIPRETSLQVAQRVRELVPRLNKQAENYLLLHFGVNDTEQIDGKPRLTPTESSEALAKIISQTRAHYRVLMIGPTPVYEPQRNARIKRLSAHFADVCQQHQAGYIDLYRSLMDDVSYKRDLMANDRVHPSTMGYKKVADLIWNDRSWWFNS